MSNFTYKGKDFFLNDERFVIYSGAIHYFRIPTEYWKDRLLKLKECGFNTVETYVAWNLHEPKEGCFVFDDNLDLGKFIDIATELGLYVIVRPGPYICAEFDFGGFPAWLLSYKDIKLRCSQPLFLEKVTNYFKKLFEIIVPRLITNGGNILMLQVENEYGSYGNDKKYLKYLVDVYSFLGADCLFFTSDGPIEYLLESGTLVSDCLPTINFGGATEDRMNLFKSWLNGKDQPLMCSEFWCGWFDYWHVSKAQSRTVESISEEIEVFMKNGYSFNVYMFCGGTNFGFTNGATDVVNDKYHAVVTSYDYCAPLSESGDRTDKYYALREILKKYGVKVPDITAKEQEKRAYGQVEFTKKANLFKNVENIGSTYYSDSLPYFMEDVGQSSGYILYELEIPKYTKPFECEQTIYSSPLKLVDCADRAIVFMDGVKIGVYERGIDEQAVFKDAVCKAGAKVQILVENTGRINYSHDLYTKKGIAEVRFGYVTFYGYKTISLPMENLEKLMYEEIVGNEEVPAFYKGKFHVDKVCDTFIKPTGFTKGFILVNGINIGRYYNPAGPQKTLYLPAPYLKEGENEIVIFESDKVNELKVELVAYPEI